MLIDTLKADLITARKAKDQFRTTLLSTVVGDLSANAVMVDGAKVVSDEAAIKTIKKFINGIDITLENAVETTQLKQEREILSGYLPKMLSEEDITVIMRDAIDDGKANIGALMGHMKSNYANLYDGKIASKIANDLLKG